MSRDNKQIVKLGDRPRIALIRLGAMGDCIYTFPLVSALKARFPGAEVSWIVEAQHQEIPWLHQRVNDVIVVNTKRWCREVRSGRLNVYVWPVCSPTPSAWVLVPAGGLTEIVPAFEEPIGLQCFPDDQALSGLGRGCWLQIGELRGQDLRPCKRQSEVASDVALFSHNCAGMGTGRLELLSEIKEGM